MLSPNTSGVLEFTAEVNERDPVDNADLSKAIGVDLEAESGSSSSSVIVVTEPNQCRSVFASLPALPTRAFAFGSLLPNEKGFAGDDEKRPPESTSVD